MTDGSGVRLIDTNVVLRYFLDDIPDQSERSRRLLDSSHNLGLTAVVIAEIAWTLCGSRYRWERPVVAKALHALLARDNIVTIGLEKSEAQAAMLACAEEVRAPNFGDSLIAACARSEGLSEIYTFDTKFERAGLQVRQIP